MISNAHGAAIGVVTSIASGGTVGLANSESLNINQSAALNGNVKSLANPSPPAPSPGVYPQATATRLQVVTYFVQVPSTAGIAPRLMRQVGGQTPIPVAENIENLQASYDIYDETSGTETSNLDDAGLSSGKSPNQIRKINLSISARANDLKGKVQRMTLATSVSARDMSFRDRYD